MLPTLQNNKLQQRHPLSLNTGGEKPQHRKCWSYVAGRLKNNKVGFLTPLVSGTNDIGGMIGVKGDSYVYNSFWDVESSGQLSSAGGEGVTSAQMKDPITFLKGGWGMKGWGLVEYWNMGGDLNDGYPYLLWQFLDNHSPVR